jgi:tetratricopeptide (TPR) repeat protein
LRRMDNESSKPDNEQVKQQLERMLSSPVFATRKTPGEILRFIVEQTLEGHAVTARKIAEVVFPDPNKYSVKSSPERSNANFMRKLVKEYNDTVGRHDEVRIKFPESKPKGAPNYTPEFVFKPPYWGAASLTYGLEQIQLPCQPKGFHLAAGEFLSLLGYGFDGRWMIVDDDDPQNVEIWRRLAECIFVLDVLRAEISPFLNYAETPTAADCVAEAIRLQPTHWKNEALLGFINLLNGRPDFANAHFQKALTINRAEVEQYGFYHAYLFAKENNDEAIALAAQLASQNDAPPNVIALYGLWLHGLRRFDEAAEQFTKALNLAADCSFAHFGRVINGLLTEPIVESDLYEATPVGVSLNHLEFNFSYFSWSLPGFRTYYERLVLVGNADKNDWPYIDPDYTLCPFLWVDEAVGSLAEMSFDRVIEIIKTAHRRNDALIRWLHMMPIFDPLSDDPRFQTLVHFRLDATRQDRIV